MARRLVCVGGDPGTGKTETMIHACYKAALNGAHVLILCPTRTLVHAYRDRVPDHPNIVVETIHSALVLKRHYDENVQYCPPSRLRRYDLIVIDEVSQIDDYVLDKLRMAFAELPQRPLILFSGDFHQLGPMGTRSIIQWIVEQFELYTLTECHRTKDPALREFLTSIRMEQPSREMLVDFFGDRRLSGDLVEAVAQSMQIARHKGQHFVWLTVTNRGAESINKAAIQTIGITEDQLSNSPPGDPKVQSGPVYAKPGLMVRLTRNLDKD